MPRTCIINYASGAWYPRGQERLCRSLVDVQFFKLGDIFAFNETTLSCPPHQAIPYGFKVAAFNYVLERGYKVVLWCDAAVWAIKPLDTIFDYIEEHGHIFFQAGWNCAQWTSDACLKQMDVSRDAAERMSQYMGCCMGFNFDHPRSIEFMKRLTGYAWDGICFPGAWSNEAQQVSTDPRCLGHRHDQTVGSIIASQLGMDQIVGHETYFAYYNSSGNVPYHYGQPNDMSGIKDSVVLLSQGM